MKRDSYHPATDNSTSLWALIAGGLTVAVAIAVIIGWTIRIPLLIQLHPDLVPMQFNTALGMLLCGAGLLLITLKVKRLAMACGLVVASLSVLTALEYLLGVNFGIDQLLMEAYISVKSAHPGRMAVNTAVCFIFTAVTIIVLAWPNPPQKYLLAATYLSGLTLAVAGVAVVGYLMGMDSSHGWGARMSHMAAHTAGGFVLTHSGLLTLLIRYKAIQNKQAFLLQRPSWVAIFSLMMVFIGWQALAQKEFEYKMQSTSQVAKKVSNEIISRLDARHLALNRMADRWSAHEGTSQSEWERDASLYIEDFPGFQAIEWVDPTYHVRWIVPMAGNEAAKDLDLSFEPHRLAMLKQAQNERALTVTAPVDLVQGGKGFLVYVPIYNKEHFEGFILGVYRIEELLQEILSPQTITVGYDIEVYHNQQLLYRRGSQPSGGRLGYRVQLPLDMKGVTWQIHITPSIDIMPAILTSAQIFLLIGGLSMAVMLTVTTYLLQTSVHQAATLQDTNRRLTEEIAGRRQYEQALRDSEQRFEMAMQGSQDGFWDWPNVDEDAEWWSPQFYELLGYENGKITASLSTFRDMLHPEDQQKTFDAVEACFQDKAPFDIEYRLRTASGDYRWFRARGVLIRNKTGKPQRMAGSIQDIHAQKLAMELIEAKNQDLETLLYVTSHDLREPLRAIQNFSKIIDKEGKSNLDEGHQDLLQRIVVGADRMDQLFIDILTLSRAQREEVVADRVNLNDVVTDILDRLSHKIDETQAKIQVDPDLPLVKGDRRWITQAVYNLVTNALKFHQPGQPPDVEIASYRDTNPAHGGETVGLVVRDRGIGVKSGLEDRIFGLFRRAVGRKVEGTGAGLAIVRQIAIRHGGHAGVQARDGGGAEFFITFAAYHEAEK